MSLDIALKFTIAEEGGYVNNPHDSGGATNHGITQATYDAYRASLKLASQDVALITDADVRAIYGEMYWIPAKCPIMHTPLDICHFDWAVNHGVNGAIKTLQTVLGVEADGVFGGKTSSALALCDSYETMKAYNQLRKQWYENRVAQKPDQQVFLNGWLARVDRLEAYCEGL